MTDKDIFIVDSIDTNLCQFELGEKIGQAFSLLRADDYPEEYAELIEEVNRRGRAANEKYKLASHREQMFASGFQAGMYIAKFDENEQMTGFEFSDGTRRMLGYDGLEDLPNEFDSWVKTLIPEERDIYVKLFWDTVRIHRELPDITHAEYRMMKKDGSIIWVTGAGKFVRREDGSLEMYMGCYREVTAEHEKAEYLRIIEGVGKVFNFSLYIDAKTGHYRIISSNAYVEKVAKCENAFDYLVANVEDSVAPEFIDELREWFRQEKILAALEKTESISKDFYSQATNNWYKGIFFVGDYDEDGKIAHIIYGCQNIDDTKRQEIESQKEILRQYKLMKSVAEVYWSLHEIDLVNNTAVQYMAHKKVAKIVQHSIGADQMMHNTILETVTPEYLDAALEFTDLTTVADRLKNKKMIAAEFIGTTLGWFTTSFITVDRDEEGRATRVVFVTKSIDEIKRREESLIRKSNTDELTGAYNRSAYEEDVERMEASGPAEDMVYLSVDVNGLKVVNDSLGHSAGDELIKGAYTCLNHNLGPFGKVYRTGGDEFVVLFRCSEEQLKEALEMLDTATERWCGREVDMLSLSYGYVTTRELPDKSLQEMAVIADKRMYEAKTLHYKKSGVDRRGQKDAHVALCALYTKILKINLTQDSYQVINLDPEEQAGGLSKTSQISVWLRDFGESGQVHAEDLEDYFAKTNPAYIEQYFAEGKNALHIFYRRKIGEQFKQVMMEIVPANDYTDEQHTYFLYVKNIDR